MRRFQLLVPLMVFLSVGCGVVADNIRMDNFQKTATLYEEALREARFEAAWRLVDPAAGLATPFPGKYRNMKVVDYEVKEFQMSEDKLEVRRTVEIRYYRLDRYILQSLRDSEVWRYDAGNNRWLLRTGLPDLE